MAEAQLTTGGERQRPRYVVYGGPWERDAVLKTMGVARYEGIAGR